MQLVWSRIWTRVAVSISYDDDHYTTGMSNMAKSIMEHSSCKSKQILSYTVWEWFNSHCRGKWTRWLVFKFRSKLFAFHSAKTLGEIIHSTILPRASAVGRPWSVATNGLDCDIVVCMFELKSRNFFNFRTNTLWKDMNHELNKTATFLL